MPKPVDYDLSQISAHVITYSDRIQRGTKEDRATPACTAALEVVRASVEVEIPGIAEQIRAHGLANTPLSGLSREVVGVTARDSSGALIISSPGSRGGALDTLEVVTPLLPAIFHQLDEQR